jgi:hypothetical protein
MTGSLLSFVIRRPRISRSEVCRVVRLRRRPQASLAESDKATARYQPVAKFGLSVESEEGEFLVPLKSENPV